MTEISPELPAEIIVQPYLIQIQVEPRKTEVTLSGSGPQGPMGPAGPRGLPGAPGGSRFEYEQVTPSAIWAVQHNLGYEPHTTVIVAGEDITLGADIYHIDPDNATIVFSQPISGKVVMS